MNTQAAHNIAERAYLIWEQMGRPEGRALDHWLRAEAELTTADAASAASFEAPAREPKRGRRKRA